MANEEILKQIGKIVPEGIVVHRDAVHFAIAPVIANHLLYPGARVGLLPSGQAAEKRTPYRTTDGKLMEVTETIGIVDPFLEEDVQTGQKFLLFLYPGTITGLRHVWSHPAFTASFKDFAAAFKDAPIMTSPEIHPQNLPTFERVTEDG